MKWEIQTILGRCESDGCTHGTIMPGEPVRLVQSGRRRWCWICARKRLMETAPKDMPSQRIPASAKPETFIAFDRGSVGSALRSNILTRRELERENANDPKLRQMGGDR